MLKYILPLALFLSLTLGSGCQGGTPETGVKLGQEFSLKVGQEVSIIGEDLKIKFAEFVGDSRCPINVVCIWQGEVTVRIEITTGGVSYTKTLVKPGSSPIYITTDFGNYEIQFDVQPYPEAGKKISKQDYYLKLIVNKKPKISGGVLVTFDVNGENYRVFTKNPTTIEQVFAVQKGESQATIPSGKLIRGTEYNQPWAWHIDGDDIHMADVTIELCEGTPSQVEANLEYWINTVKRFCPWNAKIVKVEDLR
jgi:hypothetical protein